MYHKLVFLLVVTLLSSARSIASDAVQACYDKAKTQPELTHCSGLEREAADKDLNAVYQAVLTKHKADKRFIEKFKASQRAWLKWRDAEMEAIYPESDDPMSAYGSSFSSCWGSQLAAITLERTQQLRKWVDGIEEGEVCSGSFPIKD